MTMLHHKGDQTRMMIVNMNDVRAMFPYGEPVCYGNLEGYETFIIVFVTIVVIVVIFIMFFLFFLIILFPFFEPTTR